MVRKKKKKKQEKYGFCRRKIKIRKPMKITRDKFNF